MKMPFWRLWALGSCMPMSVILMPALLNHSRAILLPHLGASTAEAEENCSVMVAEQVREFPENGTIRHSVNFPVILIKTLTRICSIAGILSARVIQKNVSDLYFPFDN
ncbi:MAG: hypothetical protein ACXV8P_08015 [Methylobacter sp.]